MSDTKPEQDIGQVSITASTGGGTSGAATPSAEPPAAGGGVGLSTGGVGATVWVSNQKVNALWTINENRNSWIGVAGVGWVKFANNSDTAIVAFTMLGANAKQTQGLTSYRQESDGMIHEIYVW